MVDFGAMKSVAPELMDASGRTRCKRETERCRWEAIYDPISIFRGNPVTPVLP